MLRNIKDIERKLFTDFEFYAKHNLKISSAYNPRGIKELMPFYLNRPQKRFYDTIKALKKNKLPVRILLLKGRQVGFSTEIQGIFFQIITTNELQTAITISKDTTQTQELLKISHLFYENLPPAFRPMIRMSNRNEMVFENPDNKSRLKNPGLRSSMSIQTPGGTEETTGLGITPNLIHGSETAFWNNPKEVLSALLPGVPSSYPAILNTMVIFETTGNGTGDNFFYNQYVEAKAGKNLYHVFFSPYYEFENYSRPLDKGWIDDLTKEEIELVVKHNLSKEQIYWRRTILLEKCFGDEIVFKRNYPATEEEAFVTLAGQQYFSSLKLMENQCRISTFDTGELIKEDDKLKFISEDGGQLKIFYHPKDRIKYIIGGDPTGLSLKGSRACAQVLFFDDNGQIQQAATLFGQIEPDELGDYMVRLGHYYNDALLAPEVTGGYGIPTIRKIQESGYWNVYYTGTSTIKYGWQTTKDSKNIMLESLRLFLMSDKIILSDPDTIQEMCTFIYEQKTERPVSSTGKSDRVMALAIALQIMVNSPYQFEHEIDESTLPIEMRDVANLNRVERIVQKVLKERKERDFF